MGVATEEPTAFCVHKHIPTQPAATTHCDVTMETSSILIVASYQTLSTYKFQKYLSINCVCNLLPTGEYLIFT